MKTKIISPLTKENAANVSQIVSLIAPEWGIKKFNYKADMGEFSTWGTGSNSAILPENEYRFWGVISFK